MSNRRKFIKSASLLLAAAGTAGYHVSYSKNKRFSINSKETKSMMHHNVYFWLKDELTEVEKKGFEKGLKKFLSSVKEIHSSSIGIPAETEKRDVVDHSFGYSIFVSFKTLGDHEIYQKHPAHKTFIEDFSSLWAAVKVYDSEVV